MLEALWKVRADEVAWVVWGSGKGLEHKYVMATVFSMQPVLDMLEALWKVRNGGLGHRAAG